MKSGIENRINVGMFGLGNVAGGVSNHFEEKLSPFGIRLKAVVVRDPLKERKDINLPDSTRLTDDPGTILDDPEIDIAVELTGAPVDYSRFLISAALERGKHVVTAGKKVLGEYLPDFMDLARRHETSISFEPSVCGTIPAIRLLEEYYQVQVVTGIKGIVNGTTNSILTEMAQGVTFDIALRNAQAAGIAEADPTDDIEGFDARSKIAILATLAFGRHCKPETIPCQGIRRVSLEDIAYAAKQGGAIKLIASAQQDTNGSFVRVQPEFVPSNNPLAQVNNTLNSIAIESDLSGTVTYIGRGAGRNPTAAAVIADIAHAAGHVRFHTPDYLPELRRLVA